MKRAVLWCCLGVIAGVVVLHGVVCKRRGW